MLHSRAELLGWALAIVASFSSRTLADLTTPRPLSLADLGELVNASSDASHHVAATTVEAAYQRYRSAWDKAFAAAGRADPEAEATARRLDHILAEEIEAATGPDAIPNDRLLLAIGRARVRARSPAIERLLGADVTAIALASLPRSAELDATLWQFEREATPLLDRCGAELARLEAHSPLSDEASPGEWAASYLRAREEAAQACRQYLRLRDSFVWTLDEATDAGPTRDGFRRAATRAFWPILERRSERSHAFASLACDSLVGQPAASEAAHLLTEFLQSDWQAIQRLAPLLADRPRLPGPAQQASDAERREMEARDAALRSFDRAMASLLSPAEERALRQTLAVEVGDIEIGSRQHLRPDEPQFIDPWPRQALLSALRWLNVEPRSTASAPREDPNELRGAVAIVEELHSLYLRDWSQYVLPQQERALACEATLPGDAAAIDEWRAASVAAIFAAAQVDASLAENLRAALPDASQPCVDLFVADRALERFGRVECRTGNRVSPDETPVRLIDVLAPLELDADDRAKLLAFVSGESCSLEAFALREAVGRVQLRREELASRCDPEPGQSSRQARDEAAMARGNRAAELVTRLRKRTSDVVAVIERSLSPLGREEFAASLCRSAYPTLFADHARLVARFEAARSVVEGQPELLARVTSLEAERVRESRTLTLSLLPPAWGHAGEPRRRSQFAALTDSELKLQESRERRTELIRATQDELEQLLGIERSRAVEQRLRGE